MRVSSTSPADIGQLFRLDAVQQAPYARAVHFDGDEVGFGMRLGDLDGGLAHARSDFKHEWTGRSDLLVRKGEAVFRKQRFQRAALSGRRPALPQYVAANRAVQAAFEEIVPSLGEEGAAL